jgi:three-Cys-motif partner protein
MSTSSRGDNPGQPFFAVVGGAGSQPAADHDDAHRPVELHRQTAHKLEVVRRYDPVFAAITASGYSKHIFLIDTHGGGGIHASIENVWTHGTPVLACYAARDIQRRFKGAQVHVRAIEKDRSAARLLREAVQRFVDAPAPDQVDVRVIEGDYSDHLAPLMREVKDYHAASRWLIDPRGIDIPRWTLEPLMGPAWGMEVIINLDASGALRYAHLIKSMAGLDDVADLQSVLYSDGLHQTAIGELFDTHTWRDSLVEGATWNSNLNSFARAYANIFIPAFRFATPYRLRSSDNQIRYLVHLTRHEKGVQKFAEAFEASKREALFTLTRLDGPGLSAVAAQLFGLYKGTETTLDRLVEEHGDRYDRRELCSICEAADRDLYGEFDLKASKIKWLPKRGKPTQTTLFPHLDGE